VVRPVGICVRTHSLPWFAGNSNPASIDLSKATKLEDVVFQPRSWSVEWISTALKTTLKHLYLRQITIEVSYNFILLGVGANIKHAVGEAN
jgi:hypothetical protein